MTQPHANAAREIRVDETSAGQRIDNFLVRTLKGVPKSRVYRILRKGEVRVNRGRIKPDYRLQSGDLVRIPPIRTADPATPVRPADGLLATLQDRILFEDSRLLVLNKPSGLAVHGGSGLSYGVIEALRVLRPEARFLELGHRLDRDTSGCLVIAKKRSALRAFQDLLRSGGMEKYYHALVKGRWAGGKRGIDAPLRKNVLSSGERIVRVSADGRPALSIFEPVTMYKGATLVRVKLITGRTHQVRVHALHSGHPIAADDKYGDAEFNRRMAALGLRRLFLHASELRFTLPDGDPVEVHAPLDRTLTDVLERLEGA